MRIKILVIIILFSFANLFAQEIDTIPYSTFRDRVIIYGDIGSNSSHFTLEDDNLGLGIKKLKFKHNIKSIVGIGFAYKWLALHIGFALPGNIKSTSKFGNSSYFDLKLRGTFKQIYYYAGIRQYKGYSIINEHDWNDSLTSFAPNGIYPDISSTSFDLDVYYLVSSKFNMHSVLGRVGHYKEFAHTVYFKNSINAFNINNKTESIIPLALTDSTDRSNANSIGAVELTLIPGYAFVNSKNNWQYSGFGGVGVALQSAYYIKNQIRRTFTGLAPRFDLRLSFGYNIDKYFIHLEGNYSLRSVQIQSMKFNQNFYNVRLVGGYRFKTKKSRQKKNQKR